MSPVICLLHPESRCTLTASMLVDAVIEVMLVNASRVAVRDCCTRLLYSGGSVGECCESHCSTRSLYSGGQYAGGRCSLEVAWVNAVGRIAVLIIATCRYWEGYIDCYCSSVICLESLG